MIAEVSPAAFVHRSGQPTELTVRVENVRETIAGVSVRILGTDPDWTEISEPELSLFPGESRVVSVRMLLPEGFPAGAHPIAVQVQEIGGARECVLLPVSVEVPGREMLLLTLKPHLVHGGRQARFGLRAENTGNTTVSQPLTGQDEEDQLRFVFDPERVELAPGERARMSVTVSCRRPWSGMPRPLMFSVFADPRTREERRARVPFEGPAAQGAFLQRPRISRTTLALGASLLAVALVIAIGVGTVSAVLRKNKADQAHTDGLVAGIGDPASTAPLTGSEQCPCYFSGHVVLIGDGFRVTDAEPDQMRHGSGAPTAEDMKRLRVSVYPADDPVHPVYVVKDIRQGGFWKAEVPSAGEYLIRFGGEGLIPTWYPQTRDRRQAEIVTAYGGDTVASKGGVTELPTMMVGLARGSVTVNLIVGSFSDVDVRILLGKGTAAPCALAAVASSPENDGTFVADNLPTPASYLIVATKKGYTSEVLPIELNLGEDRDSDSFALKETSDATEEHLCTPRPSP